MSGAHRSNGRIKTNSHKKGTHRDAPKPSRQPYNWLGAGAVTLGLGAALASGSGIANAEGPSGPSGGGSVSSGAGSVSTSADNGSGASSNGSSSTRPNHQRPARTTADDPTTGTTAGGSTTDPNPATTNKAKRPAKSTAATSPSNTTNKKDRPTAAPKPATKSNPAAATQTPAVKPAAATAKPAAAAKPVATAPNPASALAAVTANPAAGSGGSTTTTTTTLPHSTATNPIVRFVQNAVIDFFTLPPVKFILFHSGLTGPVAPNNPIGALVWGLYRTVEGSLGLVPKPGTPTTTSDPVTGTVTGTLGFTVAAGGTLKYKVSSAPQYGTVAVTTTGGYTYTSTTFAPTAGQTDTFTVTAYNGIAAAKETVTVPVLAAPDVPSTPAATHLNTNPGTGVVTGTLSSTSPDGKTVTYSATNPLNGSLTISGNTFTYTPTDAARVIANAGVVTTDSFTVTATNTAGFSSSATVTVPISPASDNTPSVPTASGQTANAITGVVTGTISATSPDHSTITYTATNPINGTLNLNSATGQYTYTPTDLARVTANLGVITSDSFVVTATNTAGLSSSATITVPIKPATGNTPTTPTATGITADANGVVTGTLSSTSPDGQTVTYTAYSLPTNGSVVIAGNTFTYTPTNAAQLLASLGGPTSDSFGVTATNAAGFTSAVGTVTVPIAPVTDTPTTPTVSNQNANPITGTVTGTVHSTDPAGQTLNYSVGSAAGGTVSIDGATGEFTYTPTASARVIANAGIITNDTFAVTVTNGTYTNTALITVPISPASNDTPSTPTATVGSPDANGVVTGTLSSTSPDGTAVTYTAGLLAGLSGHVTISGSTFTYTPDAAAQLLAGLGGPTSDSFGVTATNAAGISSSVGTVTVPITPVNDVPSTPTVSNQNANPITGIVTGTVHSTDPAGQTLTYSATNPLLGSVSINAATGDFTYAPTALAREAANLVATNDTFIVTASNGTQSSTTTVTVPVAPASNDTPSTPVANVGSADANGVVTGTLSSTSPDGTAVTYTAGLLSGLSGTVSISGSTFTYTPTAAAQLLASLGGPSTDAFGVTATNAAGFTSSVGTVTVPITPITDTPTAPVASNVNADPIGGTVTGTISSTDPAGQPLTYTASATALGGNLSLNANTGEFTYTPTALARLTADGGIITTDSFTVTASNGTYTNAALITVPVAPASADTPSVPVASNQNENLASGVVTGTVSSTSPDAGTITYTAAGAVYGSVVIDSATGQYTYAPTTLARNNPVAVTLGDAFTVTATNGAGLSSSAIVTVPISPASNDTPSTPVASNQNQDLVSGVVTGTVTATSPDGGLITYTAGTLLGLTGSVNIDSTTGQYTYTPTALARTIATTDSFVVTATNSSGFSSSATVTVPISPASNDTPSAPTASVGSADANGVVSGTLSSTSPDGTTVTYTAGLLAGLSGLVTISGNTFTYTPTAAAQLLASAGGPTSDSFGVTATNTSGFTSAIGTVTVPITPVSDIPSTPTVSNQNADPVSGIVTGTVTATDPGAQTLTYSAGLALSGTVNINSTTGDFTYTPTALAREAANLIATNDSFIVTASNGTFSSTVTVTVPIAPASNDTPSTPSASGISADANGVVTGTLSSTSPDGTAVTYSAGIALLGTVTVSGSTFTYTPSAVAQAQASLGLVTSDSFGVTATNGAGISSALGTVTVPITPVTDTPSAPTVINQNADPVSGIVTGTVTATDPGNQPLTYSATTPVLGTLSLDSTTGNFTYTPTALARQGSDAGVTTSDSFIVTASNGTFVSTATVTVPIAPASNDTPSTPTASGLTTAANGVVTGTLNSTSPDGTAVTYSAGLLAGLSGLVTISGSTFTYTPTTAAQLLAGLGGPTADAFTVTATNAAGISSAVGTVTVPITAINDVPSAPTVSNQNADPVSGIVTGTVTATDPGAQTLTYSAGLALSGTVNINSTTGDFTYTPTALAREAANLIATNDSFIVTASNGTFSSTVTVTVPIAPASNDTPSTPSASGISADANGVVTGTLSSTSPDGTAVTYTAGLLAGLSGLVTISGNTFTYTPTAAAQLLAGLGGPTSDSFGVTATNAAGLSSALGTVTVPITPVNDVPSTPTVSNQNADPVSGIVTGTVTAADPGGQALTYSVGLALSGSVSIDSTTGDFTYTPTALAREAANLIATNDSFIVTASNGTFSSSTTVTVPISPASNDTPSAPTANVGSADANGVVTGTLSSTSPDGTAVTYTAGLLAGLSGIVTISGNTFTYTPTAAAQLLASVGGPTTDSFGVTATNTSGFTSAIGTVTVPITPVSDIPNTPTVSNQNADPVSGIVTGTVTATDPGGQALTYSATTPLLGSVSVNATTGDFTYTPTNLARTTAISGVTNDSFIVTASNGSFSSIVTVTVPISPASNDTPSTPAAGTPNENLASGVVTGTVTSTSPDGSAITYTASTLLGLTGTVSINSASGQYTYTPTDLARVTANLGVITSDSFTVTATNTSGFSSSTIVTVPISPASNDTPSTPAAGTPNQDLVSGVVTGTVTSTSPDGGAVTYTAGTLLGLTGSVSINSTTGQYTYTPTDLARTTATTDSFTVTATNSLGMSSSTTVTVPVSPASNDTPSGVTSTGQSQNTNTGVVTGTLTTANNPGNQTLTYSTLGVTAQLGLVTLNNTAGVWTFTYTPTVAAMLAALGLGPTTDTFTVTVSNGDFSSSSTITVPILGKA
ncbi:hypothetical protein ABIA30_005264 [Mycobacterium sp. MAA66]|uniref:beta strand repeat-containing protein n=1 Tax=Mycobacterium sp. MAA66 TaxID=3156297 RepID=UPI003511F161